MLITRAAVMFQDGEVVEGHSYGDINTTIQKLSFVGNRLFGFMTSSDEFVLPDQAATIALKAGQIASPTDKLTPEDLWPGYAGE